jgi:PAS domain S-box-containing protein
MQQTPNIQPNFSESDIEALKTYFEFNKRYYKEVNAELRADLASDPVFGPLLKMQTPEQQEAQSARSLEMQRAAIFENKWKDYSDDLVQQGTMYARMNISYMDWYKLIKQYKDHLIPHLKKDFPDAGTTIAYLDGLTKFLDYAMYGIAEAYFTEKNNIIKSREEQFRAIFENSADNISVVDRNLKILNINRVSLTSSYKKEDIIGKNILDLQSMPEERTELQDIIDRVFRAKTSLFFDATRIVDGERKYFSSSVSPIFDAKGEVENVVFISRDVTAQKKAELETRNMNTILEKKVNERTEELKQTNEELEQFAYVASHDLQEPLRNITNYVGLLEKNAKNDFSEETQGYMKVIVKSAQRMKVLIKDLLNFSRIGRDRKTEKVDCNKVVADLLSGIEATIQANHARIKTESLPVIDSNETEIKQLFQNLVTNAIKFKKEGMDPEIRISCESKTGEWEFSVADNGIGIDEEYLDKIFLIFQRLHTESEYPGTGIGLATCKKIAELNGGRIWVASRPGKGSTFYFTIPKK